MTTILAIDAAWTEKQPSGVAVVTKGLTGWRCAGLSPSYAQFYRLAHGESVSWDEVPPSGHPDVAKLLESAELILDGETVDVVAIDMPISLLPITARRESDKRISQEFGKAGCSTHSPSATRPGKLSDSLREKFLDFGYELAAANMVPGRKDVLIEVYPHPAILKLMKRSYRLPYKASKRNKYWPTLTPDQRKVALVKVFREILDALEQNIDDITLEIPDASQLRTFTELKRYEDALDALICGWVGTQYCEKTIRSYGNYNSAIWVPT